MLKTYSGKKAMLRNLAVSLVMHEKINTTLAKAKDLQSYIDKTITIAKKKTLSSYGRTAGRINNKRALKKLNEVLVQRYENRNSGYTQIFKLGRRAGDSSCMAIIKLIQ